MADLWKRINKESMKNVKDLDNFRSSEINHRIALPNPKTNGIKYLKQFLFKACQELTTDQRLILEATKNRNYGNPITVRYHDIEVDLDYLQAALEFDFIYEAVNLHSIVEIGAGYGRTAHTILSNSICEVYTIVDLPECLELAKRYLGRVLTQEQADKLVFVPASKLDVLKNLRYDLAINIDSFAEMPAKEVGRYKRFISNSCKSFYVKNPVGKYNDPLINNRPHLAKTARKMGLLTKVIDIHDDYQVLEQVQQFVAAYRPKGFSLYRAAKAQPWSYYAQAMYHRSV